MRELCRNSRFFPRVVHGAPREVEDFCAKLVAGASERVSGSVYCSHPVFRAMCRASCGASDAEECSGDDHEAAEEYRQLVSPTHGAVNPAARGPRGCHQLECTAIVRPTPAIHYKRIRRIDGEG